MLLRLPQGPSDDDLLALSEENPGYQFELMADGRLAVSPTGSETGRVSAEVLGQLRDWNLQTKLGHVFDSSTGFRLPDGSVLSPDASFVRGERWAALTRSERQGFAPLCPDAVFEVRSPSDSIQDLHAKMELYLSNGARLAVLIDPMSGSIQVRRPGVAETGGLADMERVLPGFHLNPEAILGE